MSVIDVEGIPKCACCGKETLPHDSIFRICPVCGWQDDEIQNRDPDYNGGANHFSLNEGKKALAAGIPFQRLQNKGWEKYLDEAGK